MSRARRPVVVLRPHARWALFDAFFAGHRWLDETQPLAAFTFRRATKCITRPSILRGALLGRPVSAKAAARLLARLEAA